MSIALAVQTFSARAPAVFTLSHNILHSSSLCRKADATPEQIKAACDALTALKDKIPVIQELSVGTNFTSRTNHTHGLLVKLATKEDLPVYSDHPEHQAVVKNHILPIKEDILALDYVEGSF